MNKNFKTVFELFLTFMKIGAFTFGGGYAMIPLIQKEVVDNKKWLKDDDILEMLAIAESTPGPIAVNSATFTGYRLCGFWGAFFATLGLILPSFFIIFVISHILEKFKNLDAVKFAFSGIRAGVLALVLKSLWSMFKKCPKNAISYIIIGLAFIVATFTNVHLLVIIIGSAVLGLVMSLMNVGRGKK